MDKNIQKMIEDDKIIREEVIKAIYGENEPLYEDKFDNEEDFEISLNNSNLKMDNFEGWSVRYEMFRNNEQNYKVIIFNKTINNNNCEISFFIDDKNEVAPISMSYTITDENGNIITSDQEQGLDKSNLFNVKKSLMTKNNELLKEVPFNRMYAQALDILDFINNTPEKPFREPVVAPVQPVEVQPTLDQMDKGFFTDEDVNNFKNMASFI